MAAEGGNIVRFLYTGAVGENIPDEATHITVAEGITFVRARAFLWHRNIVEVICHDKVEKIERNAFADCHSLRRVIMPGVKILEAAAFYRCVALADIECDKLEIIENQVFQFCKSLRSINLPSTRTVWRFAFSHCEALMEVKFGSELERIKKYAFYNHGEDYSCTFERITIPLKDNLFTTDGIFIGCNNLVQVDLVEGKVHETITALHLEKWRNDMNKEIESINQILPDARAGEGWDVGEKAIEIRRWIISVLGKIDHYKAEHQRMLNEATTQLELAIWKANLDDTDESRMLREGVRTTRGSVKRARRELCVTSGANIVIKNVLPFLQLKS